MNTLTFPDTRSRVARLADAFDMGATDGAKRDHSRNLDKMTSEELAEYGRGFIAANGSEF